MMASERTNPQSVSSDATRRDFLRTSALAAAASVSFPYIVSAQVQGANNKVRVASVGVGGKGDSDVEQASKYGGEIVALCDVDENTLNKKAQKHPGAKLYRDWRKMFDEMADSIDAVTVSTPDHCHGVV